MQIGERIGSHTSTAKLSSPGAVVASPVVGVPVSPVPVAEASVAEASVAAPVELSSLVVSLSPPSQAGRARRAANIVAVTEIFIIVARAFR